MPFRTKIRLFNTMGRDKTLFEPINQESIKCYVCGPTVYDTPHLGNARPSVVFDTLRRFLGAVYGDASVIYVRNITDIDDKIILRSAEAGISIADLTEQTIKNYHRAENALNVLRPTVEPRATEHIPDMIAMIGTLIEKGHAYVSNGHVFFAIDTADCHGLLSGQDTHARLVGARVEPSEFKRNPADFVLWKPSEGNYPGWESPWGFGRPGWHIECSAMIEKHLGHTIDIHGGGADLIFPHHENERSQSQCSHGAELANFWLHNGMILADGKKMSKSLGNFVTVDDTLARAHGEAVRLLILNTHYRKPLDWSWDRLVEAKAVMDKFYRALQETWEFQYHGEVPEVPAGVMEKLADDLNTPEAIQVMHMMAENALNARNGKERARLKINLIGAGKLLGILQMTPDEWFHFGVPDYVQTAVEAKIAERNQYRDEKNWAAADAIRNELSTQGIYLEDRPERTIWRTVK